MLKYNSKIENKLIKKFDKNGFLVFDINQNKIDQIKNFANKEILRLFKKKKF